MNGDRFKSIIKENLSNKPLIIVSNREPYVHKRAGAGIKVDKPAGGLTSAMDEAIRVIGGTWVAWGSGSADKDNVDSNNCVQVPPSHPAYTLKRVWLTHEEVNNYYHGYSNHVLWPLCHISLDRVYFRKKYWSGYQEANRLFTDSILEEASGNAIVWIHDYHLCLVPRMLREHNEDLTISHFWHIPWPNYSVFRVCPQSREITESLLHNDLIGFQIPLFVHNFMECVKESLDDAEIDYHNETIKYRGHTTKLMAFPISVDFDKFHTLASSPKTTNALQKYKKRYSLSNRQVGIGVDRLEYTKGLIKRFQALDLFFERYPEYKGKFTFIQIAVPTRMKEPYISYKATVEGLVRKINKKYAMKGWNPIVYRDTKSEHEDLAAYYRMADIAIISSVYDGMNLVAKEFIASQVNKKGVLLLSEFAGAAEELEGAILVNPYDIEEFSDSIKKVLDLPEDERMCRINTLRRQVKDKDIYRWISDFIHSAATINLRGSNKCQYLFDNINEISRDNIFLFLDYDGTLTPIVETPEKAVLPAEIRSIVEKLAQEINIAIVTGRSVDNIMDIFKIDNILYAGNHGAEIWDGEKLVIGENHSEHKKVLQGIITELKSALHPVKGVIVEDKGITASIHFRMIDEQDLCTMYNIFWSIADSHKNLFKITTGKKVYEIRPHGIWNKGDAVQWMWKKFNKDSTPVYIGDGITDEDAFHVLKGHGIGIAVGRSDAADFYLKTQDEVKKLLNWFGDFRV